MHRIILSIVFHLKSCLWGTMAPWPYCPSPWDKLVDGKRKTYYRWNFVKCHPCLKLQNSHKGFNFDMPIMPVYQSRNSLSLAEMTIPITKSSTLLCCKRKGSFFKGKKKHFRSPVIKNLVLGTRARKMSPMWTLQPTGDILLEVCH